MKYTYAQARNASAKMLLMGLALSFILVGTVAGMPPHPELRKGIAASEVAEAEYVDQLRLMREKGVNAPDDALKSAIGKGFMPLAAESPVPFRVLALLVDFSDNVHATSGSYFDSLLFDADDNSVRNYYGEVSYGRIDLITIDMPSTTGWFRAPEPYDYYVDGQRGIYGDYPNNTQKLIEDLVDAADAYVDFSDYDNTGDGLVDALIVVHSGPGAEYTWDDNDIHSHKWGIVPRMKDGVYVQSYTIQPEYMSSPRDMTIGVFCHELGHIFGLPDLYDTDYSSQGVGAWCLMSYGAWNGPGADGSSPSHPSAWCRKMLGFANVVNVVANTNNQAIVAVEDSGAVFRLWNSGDTTGSEYFLVENRQMTGYDTYLPSSGLLVWHIDETKFHTTDNDAEWWPGLSGANHYLVALEQSDGSFHLEHDMNSGDAGDPFPGTTQKTGFSPSTSPASDSYQDGSTFVAVENISASHMTMHADLIVGLAAGLNDDEDELLPGRIDLAQNYPNPFNPTTTIGFSVTRSDRATLEIFNVAGRKVKILLDEFVQPGVTSLTWDGADENGRPVASGIYLYRLKCCEEQEVRKMVLVR
jgi:immune inhibitor A